MAESSTSKTTTSEPKTSTRSRVSDSWQDASDAKRDIAERLVRSSVDGTAALVGGVADSISAFADAFTSRNRSHEGSRSLGSFASDLPGDLAEGVAKGLSKSASIPERVADAVAHAARDDK